MTMKAILTSSLGGQVKMDGKRLPSKLPETNGLLKSIKAVWKNDSKVMIISGLPKYYDKNDSVLFCLKGAFSLSNLSASEVLMCDERNKEIIERLQDWDGLLIAWSAGSMNCAEMVYAGPELPGEAINPNYQR